MSRLSYLLLVVLMVVPLYPKFPLVGVGGTFVAIRLEDLVLAGIYGVWGVWAFKNKWWHNLTTMDRAVILYWIVGLVSVFSAIFLTKTAEPNLSVLHWLRRIEYMGMFIVAYSWTTKYLAAKVSRILIVVSLAVALYGLGQQFLDWPVVSTNNSEFAKGLALSLGPGARINSTFAGHYDLAAFSLFPLLTILGLLMYGGKPRWLLAGVGVLVYWTMLLSASRVTFVALILSCLVFVALVRRWRWAVVVLVLAGLGFVVSPQLVGRYKDLIVNHLLSWTPTASAQVDEEVADALKPAAVAEDRSLNIRLKASWPKAIRAFSKNPILGTGFSSVGLAIDNDYLRALAETGTLGVAAFALILIRLFKRLKPTLRQPPTDTASVFVVAVGVSLFGLLLNAAFIDIFEASKIAIVTWTLIGIAVRLNEQIV